MPADFHGWQIQQTEKDAKKFREADESVETY